MYKGSPFFNFNHDLTESDAIESACYCKIIISFFQISINNFKKYFIFMFITIFKIIILLFS